MQLLHYIPYDETIYVEADCLFYANGNILFESFHHVNAHGFSTQGRIMPRDARDGWFRIEECGKYAAFIEHTNRMHSGMIYLEKSSTICERMYDIFLDISANYNKYMFGGNSDGMDDKILSVGAMVCDCNLLAFNNNLMFVYPHHLREKKKIRIDIRTGKITVKQKSEVIIDGSVLIHWSNWLTNESLYKREVFRLNSEIFQKNNGLTFFRELFFGICIPISNFRICLTYLKNDVISNISKIKIAKKLYHIIK